MPPDVFIIEDLMDLLEDSFQSVYVFIEIIEVTVCFTYLGSVVHASGLSVEEVSRQIVLAAGAINSVKSIWRC